ncbi:FAD binding domain containing protein [Penicillium argentinense]|uniref:FAD binding domain containing protein n=1 Tax=Penicillium argentinense TaxID=1131581 RepID=A0A9W9JV13_9EURO|nr:FAD binding domain containing protein [Penicillium argentinense]KAJ5082874.1 FAD binding domain containing protein [Penicillium argentinense]
MGSYWREHVTVGIVGGGIAGLSLARMLEMSGISYCVGRLTAISPPRPEQALDSCPAGIGYLDQIGVLDHQLNDAEVPHQRWEHKDGQGNVQATLNSMKDFPELLGYGSFFTDRQRVLQALYDNGEDKSRLSTNKRVVAVHRSEQEAVLIAQDGSESSCDFVAGADGVRSVIRHEIAKSEMRLENMNLRFDAKYACVYGISNPVSGIGPGQYIKERQIRYEALRKFFEGDIDRLYAAVADIPVTGGVKFSDVFRERAPQ